MHSVLQLQCTTRDIMGEVQAAFPPKKNKGEEILLYFYLLEPFTARLAN